MPELPEVETVLRTIAPHVVGRRVLGVEVSERRLRQPIPSGFESELHGEQIVGARRRAMYLIFELGSGRTWVVHLGMSGRLVVGNPPEGLDHVHVRIRLERGVSLYFRDPRRFGLMRIDASEPELGVLGPEPLGQAFAAEYLWEQIRRHRRVAIKSLLMDQRVVVGVGNIYANEALFEAGVRPARRAGRLRRTGVDRLVARVRSVLLRAIEHRGSSLLDYRDADGNVGEFQNGLGVYDRAGDPCRACGTAIRRTLVGGRGTFWCPACQR